MRQAFLSNDLSPADNLIAATPYTSVLPSRLSHKLKPTIVFDTYWRFAVERQAIFFRRLKGEPGPWTKDHILQKHKFTNVYRASDRVSQYLIKEVIYTGDQTPKEVFFRTILFKFFNRIETWELLKKEIGTPNHNEYSFDLYDRILTTAMQRGDKIYSAAYIMPSGGRFSTHKKKHRMHLDLLSNMISDCVYDKIAECKSMKDAFAILKRYPTIGDFLAYQYVIDINYSTITNFSENDFVVAGPGAKSGIGKCFGNPNGYSDADIIKIVTEEQNHEFKRLDLEFKSLWGRPLKLIDCQNLFCETDKYARIAHPEMTGGSKRSRIKQRFSPKIDRITYYYPPKWGINDIIPTEAANV